MIELDGLRKRIEEVRAELCKMAGKKTVHDQRLLAASQVLDVIINKYDRLLI
ncbi:MAG: aspartyl-phosphate phosphatase Spo0E family protein [Peptococcaceae bacterium]|jgi:hypothetical protein|nr:aspartyl-phosphate phosphatase Spo0E family protein [Peptococcaceae bacterium]